jgi:hypothetical protein
MNEPKNDERKETPAVAVQRVVRRRKWEIDLGSGEYYHTFNITSSRKPKSKEPHKVLIGDTEIDFGYMDICGISAIKKRHRKKRVSPPPNDGVEARAK